MTEPRAAAALTACAALLLLGACGASDPEPSVIDQADVWPIMEDLVAQTVEGVPDFGGFRARSLTALDACEEGRILYLLDYRAAAEGDRMEWIDPLTAHWEGLGYEVVDGTVDFAGLHARSITTEDGFGVAFDPVEPVSFTVQSPCVADTGTNLPCPEPLHSVDEEFDMVRKFCPDGYASG